MPDRDDWKAEDAIQSGPLVRMFNRPALQKQETQLADEQTALYSGWTDEKLYLAFALEVERFAFRPGR